MDLELIISSAVSVVTVALWVVALWIGNHRTISMLAGVSDLTIALLVVGVGVAFALGLSAQMLFNPHSWLNAVGRLIQLA